MNSLLEVVKVGWENRCDFYALTYLNVELDRTDPLFHREVVSLGVASLMLNFIEESLGRDIDDETVNIHVFDEKSLVLAGNERNDGKRYGHRFILDNSNGGGYVLKKLEGEIPLKEDKAEDLKQKLSESNIRLRQRKEEKPLN